MKWIFSIIFGSIGKQIGHLLFGWIKKLYYIRKGIIKERKRQSKANEKARVKANEIRKDIDDTDIDDVREWLHKHKGD